MLGRIKRAIPAPVKVRIVNFLHVVIGKPVVSAMRERALALEQVFDQRLSRLEATVRRLEDERNKGLDGARKDLLTRQDLLISILEQRIAGLESRLNQALTNHDVSANGADVPERVRPHVNGVSESTANPS